MKKSCRIWVDRGGTFTDILAATDCGELVALKLLSVDPGNYSDAVIEGIKKLCQKHQFEQIDSIRLGTTIATNALLERSGDNTLFLVTEGFSDLLRIRQQNRTHLFKQAIKRSSPLYRQVLEVNARCNADGHRLKPLDQQQIRKQLSHYFSIGFRSLAVALLHSLKNPEDELAIAQLATDIGFTQITLSHQTSTSPRIVTRAETTVADAYLTPLIQRYTQRLEQHFPTTPLWFMQSNGDLATGAQFHGKDAILSGPAGGIVAMAKTAQHAGFNRVIGFDMGGTSTDVSIYTGQFSKSYENTISGIPLHLPMLAIHTIAAGGGSKLWFDGARLRVGPESVGAHPGPACYRNNGSLAVTDINVLLGRIQPCCFPKLFGGSANQPIDREATELAFAELALAINNKLPIKTAQLTDLSLMTENVVTANKELSNTQNVTQLATGFLTIAVNNMANAIRKISTQKGIELHDFVINAFGGAGGQHACLVADELGIQQIFIHAQSSLLSAYGMGCSSHGIEQNFPYQAEFNLESLKNIEYRVAQITVEQTAQFSGTLPLSTLTSLNLYYSGSDNTLSVPLTDLNSMRDFFKQMHQAQFGFSHSSVKIFIQEISVQTNEVEPLFQPREKLKTTLPVAQYPVFFQSAWIETPFIPIGNLSPGQTKVGPAIIYDENTTVIIEPGWQVEGLSGGHLKLERIEKKPSPERNVIANDPIRLEVFNNLFMYIAEQMGLVLQQTAHSVNIKERLDFSCAIFDCHGRLVANAPHMPVHLGSMGDSVRHVIKQASSVSPGDTFMLNSPFHGGTHLPDVTVITPVFVQSQLSHWVASRGHHADIGGTTPSSMPANSTHIEQEGVLFNFFKLLDQYQFDQTTVELLLTNSSHPARNIPQTIADLKAQIAANQKGVTEILLACENFGEQTVAAYMQYVQQNAERAIRDLIPKIKHGRFCYPMDCGANIMVEIVPRADRLTFDFSGTSKQQMNNFNAPLAVTRAAVLYVLRCLVDEEIPLNEGCLNPITLIVPKGSMLNPNYPAAVVAGNVETSQCITDAIFGALGIQAGAQGTMNNVTFGNQDHQYYETIAGGSGSGVTLAGESFAGAHAVQTHMTNSRITDPEIIEQRFPVVLEQFSIRTGSGGKGKYPGGDGVIRKFRFLEPMTLSLITNNRIHTPFGQKGGAPGQPGKNIFTPYHCKSEELPANAQLSVNTNDTLEIHTPGGGGFGATNNKSVASNIGTVSNKQNYTINDIQDKSIEGNSSNNKKHDSKING